jgi:putative hydrolase of the HAD superfamily
MAILFDFGGTLDADGLRLSLRFYRAFCRAGGRLPLAEFESLFRESDRQLAAMPGIRQAGCRETLEIQSDLLARLLAGAGHRTDRGALVQPVHDGILEAADRNRPLLEGLAREHRLGVVSNFTGNLVPWLLDLDLLAPFAVVADSAVVGVEKPDPAIFRHALDALNAEPAATWMVGDNPWHDLMPAAQMGLSTCWLAPPEDRRTWPGGVPTARISRLTHLPALVATTCTA